MRGHLSKNKSLLLYAFFLLLLLIWLMGVWLQCIFVNRKKKQFIFDFSFSMFILFISLHIKQSILHALYLSVFVQFFWNMANRNIKTQKTFSCFFFVFCSVNSQANFQCFSVINNRFLWTIFPASVRGIISIFISSSFIHILFYYFFVCFFYI